MEYLNNIPVRKRGILIYDNTYTNKNLNIFPSQGGPWEGEDLICVLIRYPKANNGFAGMT